MTTDFQCPACGWPQGPVADTATKQELDRELHAAMTAPLAAPQGEEWMEYARLMQGCNPYAPTDPQGQMEKILYEQLQEAIRDGRATDAKEGEEDGRAKEDDRRTREDVDNSVSSRIEPRGNNRQKTEVIARAALGEETTPLEEFERTGRLRHDIAGLVGLAQDALTELTAAKAEIARLRAALERQGEEGNEHKKTRQLIRDIVRAALGGKE